MEVKITDSVEKSAWDAAVSSHPAGTIYQTVLWAEYMKKYVKADPLYVTAKEGEKIVGTLLFFREGLGQRRVFESSLSAAILPVIKTMAPVGNWIHGPLISSGYHSKEKVLAGILREIESFSKGMKIKEAIVPIHDKDYEWMTPVFSKFGFSQKQWATFLVDLTADEDALLSRLSKKGRKAIRSANEQNLTVTRATKEEELREYYQILTTHRQTLGLQTYSFENLSEMWGHLHENGKMEVFLAKEGERIIAGLGILAFNGVITEIMSAQSDYAIEKKLFGSDIIKWEIIKWGHSAGYKTYDLTGVSPSPKDPKEEGIYNFKAKWGGELITYPIFSR